MQFVRASFFEILTCTSNVLVGIRRFNLADMVKGWKWLGYPLEQKNRRPSQLFATALPYGKLARILSQ